MNAEQIGRLPTLVMDALGNEITNGKFAAGDYIGNEPELAEKYEVSRTTIRKVIESLEKRKIVRRIARHGVFLADDYVALKQQANPELVFIRWTDNTLATEISLGIMSSSLSRNFKITLVDVKADQALYLETLKKLPPTVAGVITFPIDCAEAIEEINALIKKGVCVVQVDRLVDGISAPAVTFDNFTGGMLATQHLFSELKLPVFYFGDHNKPESMSKRFQGWRSVMMEHGYIDYAKYIIPGFDGDVPSELNQELFNHSELEIFLKARIGQETAIFAGHDFFALAIYTVAEKLRMKIREDIFVVGFDDLELCKTLSPKLSSIRVPRRQLGVEAVDLLNESIQHVTMRPLRKLLPVELVVRESSRLR